jgi:hypothetical protein
MVPFGTKNSRAHFFSRATFQKEKFRMRSFIRRLGIAGIAALSLAGATLATSSTAEARYYHRGWGGGWGGPAFVGGLALGAIAARPYYGYGYGYPAYGYYDDGCGLRRRVVGYTPYGRPIVRLVRACYY